MDLSRLVEQLEQADRLDPMSKPLRRLLRKWVKSRDVRDLLHGVPLGHPLHPMLTDLPVGAWTAASVLDFVPGTGPASGALIALGMAAVPPTVLSGWTDWAYLHQEQQRVGLVHAAANVTAVACYALSLGARLSGRPVRGKVLALAGLSAVTAGGFLGGHLAYRQAASVNHAEEVPHRFPAGWQRLGPLVELPESELVRRTVAGVDLAVHRSGERVDVLADTCAHLAGPLSEGDLLLERGERCVRCPWHASVFRLADGAVVHGPATSPQPVFETRVTDGEVEVRLPGASG